MDEHSLGRLSGIYQTSVGLARRMNRRASVGGRAPTQLLAILNDV